MSGEGEVRRRGEGGTGRRRQLSVRRAPLALAAAALLLTNGGPGWSQPQPAAPAPPAQTDLQRLYEGRAEQALWTEDTRRQLAAALAGAARHGLDASPVAKPGDLATAADATLSQAALRYAAALARGATDPARLHAVFELRRNSVDLGSGLSTALASGQLRQWLDSLAPADAQYQALSAAYVAARAHDLPPAVRPIAAGPAIAPGASDPRVPAIARRLRAMSYLSRAPHKPKALYAGRLVAAVKRLQADSGLTADGVIGASTLKALNGGVDPAARTLAVNLERLRWLARDPPPNRIDVNIAAAELQVVAAGAVAGRHKVIVGAPRHETPPLEATFSRIVVNPPWYVPQEIARREILPKGRGYLARHGMVVRDGRVVQKPGPGSALGQVKFDLQDDHAIYLHDTPTKALFGRAGRHLSHGCVRVEDAVGLAAALAEAAGRTADLEEALASPGTHTISLGLEIPVRLVYLTAFLEDGAVRFAPDAYGWDDEVAEALGLGAGAPRKRTEKSADVGP